MSRENLINPVDDIEQPGFFVRLFETLEGVLNGRTRNTGSVTLADSSATTVVNDPLFESQQVPLFTALTANAAAEVGAGGMYVSSRGNKTFTITHANNAQTDRDFEYIIVG